jgi:Uma2 family endonuclease
VATNSMRLSADDVLRTPVPPHLRGYELVDGELVEVTPASFRHGCVAAELAIRIGAHVREQDLDGHVCIEGGYVLDLPQDPERLRGPDVSYVSGANLRESGGAPPHGFARFVPDLVVEVDSPGRRPRVEQERIQNYIDAGVRLLWVVHTETRSATVYRPDGSARVLREHDAFDGEEVLPGLSLPLHAIFARVPGSP